MFTSDSKFVKNKIKYCCLQKMKMALFIEYSGSRLEELRTKKKNFFKIINRKF